MNPLTFKRTGLEVWAVPEITVTPEEIQALAHYLRDIWDQIGPDVLQVEGGSSLEASEVRDIVSDSARGYPELPYPEGLPSWGTLPRTLRDHVLTITFPPGTGWGY